MSVSTHIFDSVQGKVAADAIKRRAVPHGPKRRRFFVRGVAPEENRRRLEESIFHWRTALKNNSTICVIRPVGTRSETIALNQHELALPRYALCIRIRPIPAVVRCLRAINRVINTS